MFGALYFGETYVAGVPLVVAPAAVPAGEPGTVTTVYVRQDRG